MKKITVAIFALILAVNSNAQLIDFNKIDLSKLDISSILGKKLTVKQGWAPKFSLGNIDISKVSKVSKIINIKNINTATKLFNTYKTGRTIYKAGAYVSMAATAYSVIKNAVESNKQVTNIQEQQLKSEAIKKAQNLAITSGATMLTSVLVKLLTKSAASKAADAFNGVIRKKIQDILSIDAPTPSAYAQAGVALKIKL